MKKYVIGLALPFFIGGCSGFLLGKSNLIKPTALDSAVPSTLVHKTWTAATGASIRKTSGMRFTIAQENNTLFVVGEKGKIAALDLLTGNKLWEKRTEALNSGISVSNGTLLMGTKDAKILALSAIDGSEKWRKPLLGSADAAPASDGDIVIVRTLGGAIQTFNLQSGAEGWSYMMMNPELNIRGGIPPILFADKVLVPNDLGQLGLLQKSDGKVLWGLNLGRIRNASLSGQVADIDSEPLIVGNIIYAAAINSGVSAIDAKTGIRLWSVEKNVYPGMAYFDNALFAVDDKSTVYAFSTKDGGNIWSSNKLLGRRLTKPVIVRDRLVVGDLAGFVHLFDTQTGSLIGSTKIGSTRFLPDILEVNGAVYLQDEAGKIHRITI